MWNSDFGFVVYYIVYIVYIVVVSILCPGTLDPFVVFTWNFAQAWPSCISSRSPSLVSMTFIVCELSSF